MDAPAPVIVLSDVAFAYPGRGTILDGADLTVRRGDRIGLLGPNGSGKTTLFHVIMGLLKPNRGRVEVFGKVRKTPADFDGVYRKVGLLFQDADDQLFCPTVLEDVAFGPLNLGKPRDEAVGIARKTLAYLGLDGFEDRVTHQLSGGEKRLVSLATVLAMSPEVLLLDEPTTGLDDRTRSRLMEILADLDLTFLLISHEMEFLAEVTNAVYVMEGGKILTDRKVSLHQHVHAHPHGSHPHEHR